MYVQTPRCAKTASDGKPCRLHAEHLQKTCSSTTVVPSITRDPLSAPFDPKRK